MSKFNQDDINIEEEIYDENYSTKTPFLNNLGKDLTYLALTNKLDPVIGREKEIERISQILSKRKKNNPILIGEPGVGKSSIVEGLAYRIVNKKIYSKLYNKRIILLDILNIISGTKYRGQFEEKINLLINELKINKDIIIFIDEIHTIIGSGNNIGALDISNILKPFLSKGEIQCIGATTLNEYKKYIEKDGALDRRFQKIILEPTSEKETINILNKIKKKYQDYHDVVYTDKAIKSCVYLSSRYINDKNLPDKAIDILDEAGSRVNIKNVKIPFKINLLEKELKKIKIEKFKILNEKLEKFKKYEEADKLREKEKKIKKELIIEKKKIKENLKFNKSIVYEKNISEIVSVITGIPIRNNDFYSISKLKNIIFNIKKKIIGQDLAIEKVVKYIKLNLLGIKNNKPIGSFIFIGNTGVGKTFLSKIITNEFFINESYLLRINMSEYQEKNSINKMIGSPPGYIGYDEGGQLTEFVRRKPYSVILLDEIEKAHKDIFNILLPILDDGTITDNTGKIINFRNTLIILTSNIGTKELYSINNSIGFEKEKNIDLKVKKSIIKKNLEITFSQEFLNRIDEIIIFNNLNKENISSIINIELKILNNKIKKLGYNLFFLESIKKYILNHKNFNIKYGARNIKKIIQNNLLNIIYEYIISGKINKNKNIHFYYENNKIKFLNINN
ncbi:AAA family ATPase [Candidatus Shikimatogenerans silvanidophilus]|uniref:AAA family ATPase n=1 Tax=Candidatus Shikimatogenerans silvanidophilus TaxID=2782547 RepID=UPI001BAAF7DD|nr:ATP-dependent Clp protease ATP-binding subunit [Candidatus Shikimatogenerans silvanidophilus]